MAAAVVIIVALAVSMVSVAFASTFPDVPAGHAYETAVNDLSSRGIISGYGNGYFGLNDQVKRAQFAKMIVGTLGITPNTSTATRFIDLGTPDSNGYPHIYVQTAYDHGITYGTNPPAQTKFDPWTYIRHDQVVSMIVRGANNDYPGSLATPPPGSTSLFAGVPEPHGSNLRIAEYNGLLDGLVGMGSGWSVTANATRGEVAQMLRNLLTKLTPTSTTTTTQAPTTYSFDADPDYLEGAQMFDEQEALDSIEFLASDELQGRLVGTPGNHEAGDCIAARFAKYGLQPAGVGGGYFQPFTSMVTLNVEQPVLTVTTPAVSGGADKSHTYVPHYEYVPRIAGYLGSGRAAGQVVWLGQCAPSDFDASLANQIVLCAPIAAPEQAQAVQKALQFGVGGLLIIREDDGPYARSAYGYGELIDMAAFRVSYAIAEDLLAGSPYTLDDLEQLATPTRLATTVDMGNAFERTERQARNVLGLLPGVDPLLRDEIVIVGAHYDHVGVDPEGTIYNGANDNASGVAVMLEIARLWQAQGYRPARSVLFAAWDAEEQGLYGSKHYVSKPIYPLDRTVAYLNLDMVGVGDQVFIYGDNNAMVDQLLISAEAFDITPHVEPQYLADDLPFHDAGIPTGCCIFDANSPNSYLHRPEDDPQIIQPSSLRTAGILAAHALFSVSVGR